MPTEAERLAAELCAGAENAKLTVVPITLREAHAFVSLYHRHHSPSRGGIFAVACATGPAIRGVAVVGRPVARQLQDGYTAEVTRLATDGVRNGCSLLYAAAWRAARAMGYRRIVTYILGTESGISLRAADWKAVHQTRAESWHREARPRVDTAPLQEKIRWETSL